MIGYFICIGLLVAVQAKYQRITNANTYFTQWQQQVPLKHIHDVSHLAIHDQLCAGGIKCPFYYYTYNNPQIGSETRNRTVLLVGGMHGNQYLGPHALLYGYKYFKGANIVYFPLVNPSGFDYNKRETYPTNRDPNRDYPVDGNSDCYTTNAAIILDHLFRTYSFDLTLILHDGSNQISFNWGTNKHFKNSHTEDYEIQISIAQMMERAGGENSQLGMSKFQVGTMNQVIYPVSGSFDDWAYAVGKFPKIITTCRNYKYQPYPQGMSNGLVFLVEMGPQQSKLLGTYDAIQLEVGEKSSKDGFVSRGIRVVKAALDVLSPSLQIKWSTSKIEVSVKGCPSAVIKTLQISESSLSGEIGQSVGLLSLKQPVEVKGNVGATISQLKEISLERKIQNLYEDTFQIVAQFQCSKEWIGKGTTFFSTQRTFKSSQITTVDRQLIPATYFQVTDWLNQFTLEEYLTFAIIVIVILALMSAIFAILRCLLRPVANKGRGEKFQHPQAESGEFQESDLHTARGGIIGDM